MSSNLKVVSFHLNHIEQLKLKAVFQGETVGLRERIRAATSKKGSYSCTVTDEKGPIAILGLYPLCEGSVEAWSLMSDRVKEYSISFVRLVMRILNTYFRFLKLRRMQTLIKDGHPELKKWAQTLKFECEGLLRNYGPDGSNYFMYSRIT